jgi:hypothetical protein
MRVEVFLKDKFLKVLFLGERNYIHLGFVFFFETGFHCVAQAGLKLLILLPLPPDCWDYRYELQCSAACSVLLNIADLLFLEVVPAHVCVSTYDVRELLSQ